MFTHVLSIIAAAIVMFALGSVWYSPVLFAAAWMREAGVDPSKKPDGKAMARTFGGTFVLLLLSAAVLDCILVSWAPGQGMTHGLSVGFLGGVLAAATTAINYLFECKSLKLFLINAGYDVIGFCLMGLVLSLF
jgi:hypothetical protein